MKGISSKYRRFLQELSASGYQVFDNLVVTSLLKVSCSKANYILRKLSNHGWLKRIKRGHYILVPIAVEEATQATIDPWIEATALFSPCYIGGWDAIQHWGLTDQLFHSCYVYTTKMTHYRKHVLEKNVYMVQRVPQTYFVGMTTIWKDNTKILMTDPSRTVIDLFNKPSLYGGIAAIKEVYWQYLHSTLKDMDLLLQYALALENSAILKRMGFLTEYLEVKAPEFIIQCKKHLNKGLVKLDPKLTCPKLITRWHLWVPEHFKE